MRFDKCICLCTHHPNEDRNYFPLSRKSHGFYITALSYLPAQCLPVGHCCIGGRVVQHLDPEERKDGKHYPRSLRFQPNRPVVREWMCRGGCEGVKGQAPNTLEMGRGPLRSWAEEGAMSQALVCSVEGALRERNGGWATSWELR